jgi:hypothetical protein
VAVGEVLAANRKIFGWRQFFSSSVLRIPVRPPLHPDQTGFCIPVRPPSHPGQTALASRSGRVGNRSEATRSDRPSIPVRPALQANPVRPTLHPGQTGFAQFKWLVLPRFCRLSSVSRIVFCTGLLPFHRFYLGALVTSWLEYPRFRTLLLLYRSGVSRFLVFSFGALSWSDRLVLWWSAMFWENIHPSLGSWSSECLCLFLGVWVWDRG